MKKLVLMVLLSMFMLNSFQGQSYSKDLELTESCLFFFFSFKNCKQNLNACNNDLNTCDEQLGLAQGGLDVCLSDLDTCASELEICQNEASFGISQTGSTKCIDSNGSTIPCAGTGQDGDIMAGVAPPDPRFTDNMDGTIVDNLTGLIWLKNANCFGGRSWEQALNDANTLQSGDCGLTDSSVAGDWYLPNIRQLESLVDYGNSNPALPSGHPFSNLLSFYWSSTTDALETNRVWRLGVNVGDTNLQAVKFIPTASPGPTFVPPPLPENGVLPVRNGPTLPEWGFIALPGILGLAGIVVLRRRKMVA